jgi:hypothetical protein
LRGGVAVDEHYDVSYGEIAKLDKSTVEEVQYPVII